MESDDQFADEEDESSPKDRFENVFTIRESTSFTSTIQREDRSIILLPLPHSHLGDEGITNILSDVLIKSQGQETKIGNTTCDELTLLAVAGLPAKQQSSCPTIVALSTSTHIFDVE